jgi:P27 family predicted phage terminase small subunit
MAKTGRPRKPAALKVVKGNFKPAQKPSADEKPGKLILALDAPLKPAHLDEDETAIWDQLIPHLSKIGTLQKCDAGSLETYCTQYASLIRNKKALAEHRKAHGSDFYSTDGRHGEVVRTHPAVGIIERAGKQVKSLATEFGMTPASRKGMGYDPNQLFLPLENDDKTPTDPTAGLIG